jgi:hypothetical protein
LKEFLANLRMALAWFFQILRTPNGRIRIKTLFRDFWQHKTVEASWQQGQNLDMAKAF